MAELGQAYVQIIPSANGISGSISSALKPEATSAGNEAGGILGSECISAAATAVAAGAAVVAGAVAGIVKLAGSTAEYGDTIDKQSQKIGVSNKAYQEWSFVLQHCGTDIGTMQTSMKSLSKAVDSESDAFGKLGLSMDDVKNMSQEDLFGAVIAGLQEMEPGAERNALASSLLGRSYMELAPLLNTSAEETQNMKDAVNELGGVMSDDAVSAAAGYQDSLLNMQTAFNGIKNTLGSAFIPIITQAMNAIAGFLSKINMGAIIQNVITWFTGLATTAGTILKPAVDGLKGAFDSYKKALSPIFQVISKVTGGMNKSNTSMTAGKIAGAALTVIVKTLTVIFKAAAVVISTVVTIVQKVIDIFGKAKTAIGNLKTAVSEKAKAIRDAIKDKFEDAKQKVQPLIDILKTAKDKFDEFKKKVTAPFKFLSGLHIPRISISGGKVPYGIGGLGEKPSISVKWNKDGGIFDGASIIGYGVGEAGKEAIVPLDRFWDELHDSQNDQYSSSLYHYFKDGQFLDDLTKGLESVTMEQDGREFGRLVREAVRA